MRIVIIEDEVKIREGIRRLIELHTDHIVVGTAADGREGLEMILRFKPDLIIADIQMPEMNGLEVIKEIRGRNISAHVVILSGYSEFEYAQKAIQYGVDKYLLKPLGADDVQKMLCDIEEKMRQEEMIYGTAEMHFRNLLNGDAELTDKSRAILEKLFDVSDESILALLAVYTGDADAGYRSSLECTIGELKEKYSEIKIIYVYMENSQKAYILAAGETEERINYFERSIYNRLISNYCGKKESPVWAKCRYKSLTDTREAADKLDKLIGFSITGESGGWIPEKVLDYEPQAFVPPADIYNKIRSAVCRGEEELFRRAEEEFVQYMREGSYGEEDVRGAFIKSYYLIGDALQDIDKAQFAHLKKASVLKNLEQAVTRHELETAYRDIPRILFGNKVQKEDISNYVIKKAINYIREHYQEGITLEEVSGELDITPEYLSTLFTREVGIKFSIFLKQFRISHAKRLLRGTDKKIYEIAQEVGYSDSKYFQRVFKEEIGVSPGEYRQMNG